MKYETITTHDIRVGDRIVSDAMVLLVDQDPRETNHPKNEYSPTLATPAVIENWDDLVAQAEADQARGVVNSNPVFIVGMVRNDMSSDGHRARNALPPYTEPRWTIQGNGLARWARIVSD